MSGLLAALAPVIKLLLQAFLPLIPEMSRDTMEDAQSDDALARGLLDRLRD